MKYFQTQATAVAKFRHLAGMCGSDDSGHGVSGQARADVQLVGWQNTWEQAPGVPATPSPP